MSVKSHLTPEQQQKLLGFLTALTPADLLSIVKRMNGHTIVEYRSNSADEAPGYIMAAFLTDQNGMDYALSGIANLTDTALSQIRDTVASLHGYASSRSRIGNYKTTRNNLNAQEKRMFALHDFYEYASALPRPPKLTLKDLEARETEAQQMEETRKRLAAQPIKGIRLKLKDTEPPAAEEGAERVTAALDDDTNPYDIPDADEEAAGYQSAASLLFHEAMDRANAEVKSGDGKKKITRSGSTTRNGSGARSGKSAEGTARIVGGLNPGNANAAALAAIRADEGDDDDE